MLIRTSTAFERSFYLLEDRMLENSPRYLKWYLLRADLKQTLERNLPTVKVGVAPIMPGEKPHEYALTQGVTQHNKKFIQIGCKRFVGVNRTRLIRWAKSAKS